MPLAWEDIFFEDQAETILDMCLIPEDKKSHIKQTWAETVYEATHEGRKTALADLQQLAVQYQIDTHSIGDRRREMLEAHTINKE